MSRTAKWLHKLYLARWFLTRPLSLGVRVLLPRGDAILLVRHSYQDAWFLPGGGVNKGESLEEAARREVREETGATVGALRLFGAYSTFLEYKNDHVIVFCSDDWTEGCAASREIEGTQLFPFDALPESTSPGTRRRIAEYRQGLEPYVGQW